MPPGTGPFAIIVGPDEKLWFSEIAADGRASPRLGRLAADGAYSEVGSNVRGFRLTRGADGAVWVVSSDQKSIIRVTVEGAQTTFPVTSSYDVLLGIASGADGNLWFLEEFFAEVDGSAG